MLRIPISSVFAALAGCYAVYFGCFETPEAYAGVMDPCIECFETLVTLGMVLCNTEFGVSKHRRSKLVLRSLLFIECF